MRKAAFFAYHKIRIHRGLWMKEQENLTGKGITAAVLDSGIFPHMDFAGLGESGRASGWGGQGTAPGGRFGVVKILDRR